MEKSPLVLSAALALAAYLLEAQTTNGLESLVAGNKILINQIVACVAPKESTKILGLEYDFSALIAGTAYSVRFVLKKPLIGINQRELSEFNLFIVSNIQDQKFSGEFSGDFFTEGTSLELPGPPEKILQLDSGEAVEIPRTVRLPVDGLPENEGAKVGDYQKALKDFISQNCLYV